MYANRLLLLLHVVFIHVGTSFFGPMMGDDDTDKKIHRKATSNDDENFFDLEQKDVKGKTIDFDRFAGFNTIVAFNLFKEGQSCADVDKIFKDFLQLNYLSPISIYFAIAPESMEDYNKCSHVVTNNFVKKKVNHVILQALNSGKKHAAFDYFSNLYEDKEIGDETYFLVQTEGDVELHYECATPLKMEESLAWLIDRMHNPPHYSEM